MQSCVLTESDFEVLWSGCFFNYGKEEWCIYTGELICFANIFTNMFLSPRLGMTTLIFLHRVPVNQYINMELNLSEIMFQHVRVATTYVNTNPYTLLLLAKQN